MKKKFLLLTAIALTAITFNTMAQVPSYVPTSGLIGYFGFNNTGNDAISFSIPTSNTAISTTDRFGIANSAYQFNGANVIKYNGANPLGTIGNSIQTFSINFWVNTSNTSGSILLGAFGWGYHVDLTSTNKISLTYINTSLAWTTCNSLASISANNWHMITVIKSGSTVTICIDNVIDNTIASVPNIATYSSNNCWFGANGQDNNGYLSGKLDDIGLWNRALTQSEISTLYQGCNGVLITTQPINQTVNINNNAHFIVASSNTSSTYQWQTNLGLGFQNLSNAGQYYGAINDTLVISNTTLSNNNQTFRCIATSSSCSDTSDVAILTVIDNTGINVVETQNLFSVYPNPATNQINVKVNVSLIGSTYIITDQLGKVVLSGKLNAGNSLIELDKLSGGIYVFSIGSNTKQTFKVIKQ